MMSFTRHLLMLFGLVTFGIAVIAAADRATFPVFQLAADDTDSPGSRSGLGLRIDDGTGCHWLESRYGGLAPRLAADGKQICRR